MNSRFIPTGGPERPLGLFSRVSRLRADFQARTK